MSRTTDHAKYDPAGLVLLETQTFSNVATLNITSNIDSTYKSYLIKIIDCQFLTDNQDFYMRLSDDGGSTWKSGASDYQYALIYNSPAGTAPAGIGAGATNQIRLSGGGAGVDTSNEYLNIDVTIYNPANASSPSNLSWFGMYERTDAYCSLTLGQGQLVALGAIDAWQFYATSGNVSGIVKIYGVL